ncbi:MAG: DUF1211 domain-containing protein [Deltaproteobacteria bacterium]|nr:DUF1211 domain-containing protein [Deltaproteobacteria bacterium]
MALHYNQIAAGSTDRLAGLSDGLFGVAMTLLVLDLHLPQVGTVHDEHALIQHLGELAPRALIYLMSFLTLGIFWVGQQTQINQLDHADRNLTWIHLLFLFAVTLVPFSTKLLASFPLYRTSVVVYWLNIALLGLFVLWSWLYAVIDKCLKPDVKPETSRAICRRLIHAQLWYAGGAALCIVDTRLSIVMLVLVQLNFAVRPLLRRVRHV